MASDKGELIVPGSSGVSATQRPSMIKQTRLFLLKPQIEYLKYHSGIKQQDYTNLVSQAVVHINAIAKKFNFPANTTCCAMQLFQRTVLFNKLSSVHDLIVACVLLASKIEDTPKKAIELLRASYQIRGFGWIADDNPRKKSVLGQERVILETIGFDFRIKHAHEYIVPICKSESANISKRVAETAWAISLDSVLADVILRYPAHVVAFASILLAAKAENQEESVESLDQRKYEIHDPKAVDSIIYEFLLLYTQNVHTELQKYWNNQQSLQNWKELYSKKIQPELLLTDRIVKGVKPRDHNFDPKGTIRYVLDWEIDHVDGELVT